MLIKFEVGGVYSFRSTPFKVTQIAGPITRVRSTRFEETRITGDIMWVRQVHDLSGDGICQQINVDAGDIVQGGAVYADDVQCAGCPFFVFTARDFHCLHPFFPSDNSLCKAYLRDCRGGLSYLPEWLCRFHKKIMKTFVLFFFSIKLIVLARRVKERMYAPPNLDCENDMGGIGFIATQENFDRAAKSQRIE